MKKEFDLGNGIMLCSGVESRKMSVDDLKDALGEMHNRLAKATQMYKLLTDNARMFTDTHTDTMGILPCESTGSNLDYFKYNTAFWADRVELETETEALEMKCLNAEKVVTLHNDLKSIISAFDYEKKICEAIVKQLEYEIGTAI